MQIVQYSKYTFMDQNVLNTAQAVLYGNWQTANAYFNTPGVANGSSMTVTTTGLIVGLTMASPFGVQFSSGVFAGAYGTTNGASAGVYNTDLTSFVPGVGSQTVYLIASAAQVQQSQNLIVGPPPGHPDYDPTFTPTTVFTQLWDTIAVTATTTVPNNTNNIELARVTLSAGQITIAASSVLTTSQLKASSFAPLYGLLTGNNTWSGTNLFTAAVLATSTLNVTGAAVFGGTMNVSGATALASSLVVTGPTTLASTLNVSGIGTFSSAVVMNSTLGVSGNIRTNGTFTQTATAGTNAFSGTLVVPVGNFPGTMLANDYNETTIFTANGNFTPLFSGDYLVCGIGGGGSGGGGATGTSGFGGSGAGGGGGGAIVWAKLTLVAGTSYQVVIGPGGAGVVGGTSSAVTPGNDGTATTFGPTAAPLLTAAGGAGGFSGGFAGSGNGRGWGGGNGAGYGGGKGGATAVAGIGPSGQAAQANTGGGGGGGAGGANTNAGGAGGAGGSGILIVMRA